MSDIVSTEFAPLSRAVEWTNIQLAAFLDMYLDQPELLVDAFVRVGELRKQLAQMESVIEAKAIEALDILPAPEGVEVKGGTDRKKWDALTLAGRIAERFASDENGEFDPEVRQIAEDAMRRFLDFASVAYFRTTALKAEGVRFSDACETTPGRRRLVVTPRAIEGAA